MNLKSITRVLPVEPKGDSVETAVYTITVAAVPYAGLANRSVNLDVSGSNPPLSTAVQQFSASPTISEVEQLADQFEALGHGKIEAVDNDSVTFDLVYYISTDNYLLNGYYVARVRENQTTTLYFNNGTWTATTTLIGDQNRKVVRNRSPFIIIGGYSQTESQAYSMLFLKTGSKRGNEAFVQHIHHDAFVKTYNSTRSTSDLQLASSIYHKEHIVYIEPEANGQTVWDNLTHVVIEEKPSES